MTDLNSYIVDDAGYVIDTFTVAKVFAEDAKNAADLLGPDADLSAPDFIPGMSAIDRAEVADKFERLAAVAARICAQLRAPQIDERNHPDVGWDAKHSVA